jgi:hypothetical protein
MQQKNFMNFSPSYIVQVSLVEKVSLPFKNLAAFLQASETLDLKLNVNEARNFWGFIVGIANAGEVRINEVMLNQPDWLSEDFSMQQAIIEDLLYSARRQDYIIGGIRSHHRQGLVPSPEDLQNLSGLQVVNPAAIFLLFDISQLKSYAELGIKVFCLADPSRVDLGIREIPVQVTEVDEKVLNATLSSLYGGSKPIATPGLQPTDDWLIKATDAIELENYADAEIFYKKLLQDAQKRNDFPQQLEIELKLLNLLMRDQKYGRAQRQAEKIRAKALEKSQMRTVALCYAAEGKALAYLGNRTEALQAFEKAAFQFQNVSDHIGLAQVQILTALVHIGMGNRNQALEFLFKAVGNFRNVLDEQVRQEYLRAYLLEENAKNLILSFPDKVLQQKYIKMLNDLSEFRGYKVTLDVL